MPNIELMWMKDYSTEELSLGGAKVLRAFAQYSTRVLEQCIHTQFSPYLNPGNHEIVFFNTSYSSNDMLVYSRALERYLALGPDQLTVLAESDSYNNLGKLIGLSNVSVRNNMN